MMETDADLTELRRMMELNKERRQAHEFLSKVSEIEETTEGQWENALDAFCMANIAYKLQVAAVLGKRAAELGGEILDQLTSEDTHSDQ